MNDESLETKDAIRAALKRASDRLYKMADEAWKNDAKEETQKDTNPFTRCLWKHRYESLHIAAHFVKHFEEE